MYSKIFILSGILLFACNDIDPNQEPNPYFSSEDRYGVFKTDTLYAILDSVIYRDDPNTYLASKTSIGKLGDFDAAFVMAFVNSLLPPDSVISEIDSVKLGFTAINTLGQAKNQTVDIYRIQKLWSPEINKDLTWKNPSDSIDFVTTGTIKYALKGDTSYSEINLPVEVFDDWRNSNSENRTNYGLYIRPSESENGNIIELSSEFGSTSFPKLTYYFQDAVVVDSVSIDSVFSIPIFASATATIFNYDKSTGTALNPVPGEILISSGVITNSLLKFDFSSLPDNAIYYSADLRLNINDVNDYENPSSNSLFEIDAVENISDGDPVINPGNLFYLNNSGGITNFNLSAKDFATIFLQSLKNNALTNKWLLLKFPIEYREFSMIRFYGADTPQKDLRPRLIIKYLESNN